MSETPDRQKGVIDRRAIIKLADDGRHIVSPRSVDTDSDQE